MNTPKVWRNGWSLFIDVVYSALAFFIIITLAYYPPMDLESEANKQYYYCMLYKDYDGEAEAGMSYT